MRSVKRSVALALVAAAAGGAVSLGAAGAVQAAPAQEGKAAAQVTRNWDRDHGRDRDHGWDRDRDRHDGHGWDNRHRGSWQYAGTYRTRRACEKVAYLGEISNRWDDTKCSGGGWGGVKLFVKKHRWGW